MILTLTAAFRGNFASDAETPAAGATGAASQNQAKPFATQSARSSEPKIPCKTPENTSLCYWAHGRLAFYAEYPPLRIWKIGTARLLGVFSGPSRFPPRDNRQLFLPELPENLDRIYRDRSNWDPPFMDDHIYDPANVFADFEVCPLVQEKKGKMQPVCIESAKNIFVQK